jgi:anthranilate synthase
VGFAAPAVQIEGSGFHFKIKALNDRGRVLVSIIQEQLARDSNLFHIKESAVNELTGYVISSSEYFPEEERSKQPSEFPLVEHFDFNILTPQYYRLILTC